MKITKIETFTHRIEWCNRLFVRATTDGAFTHADAPGIPIELNLDALRDRSSRRQLQSRSTESLWH